MRESIFQLGRALKQSVLGAVALVATACAAMAQGAADQASLEMALIAVLIVGWIIYIVPTIIAFRRKHPNRWLVLVVNVVFGATGLGWLGSLVWACSALHVGSKGNGANETRVEGYSLNPAAATLGGATKTDHSTTTYPTDPIERLRRLQALRDSGALDEREFKSLKAEVLR